MCDEKNYNFFFLSLTFKNTFPNEQIQLPSGGKNFFHGREKYFPREEAEKSPCKMQGHDVVAWGDGNHSQMSHASSSSFVSTGLFGSAVPIVLMLISDFVFTSIVVVSGAIYFFIVPSF